MITKFNNHFIRRTLKTADLHCFFPDKSKKLNRKFMMTTTLMISTFNVISGLIWHNIVLNLSVIMVWHRVQTVFIEKNLKFSPFFTLNQQTKPTQLLIHEKKPNQEKKSFNFDAKTKVWSYQRFSLSLSLSVRVC